MLVNIICPLNEKVLLTETHVREREQTEIIEPTIEENEDTSRTALYTYTYTCLHMCVCVYKHLSMKSRGRCE